MLIPRPQPGDGLPAVVPALSGQAAHIMAHVCLSFPWPSVSTGEILFPTQGTLGNVETFKAVILGGGWGCYWHQVGAAQ